MYEYSIILAFHQTSERFFPGVNNIRPRHFFALIDLLRNWDCTFDGDEESAKTRPATVLTFDDGYESNYDVLIRAVESGIRPIVFIPTDYIGRRNSWDYSSLLFPAHHLDAGQIRGLAEAGVVIGSHGASHRSLTAMGSAAAMTDLIRSKRALEDITGGEITLLSFPFGRTSDRVNAIARECGYTYGFGIGTSPDDRGDERFHIPRIPVHGIDDYFSLKSKLSGRCSFLERMKIRTIKGLAGGTIIISPRLK
jgi:peptidoglycan/xylan/chitin deacetylase (PgdA/CDA1 family)